LLDRGREPCPVIVGRPQPPFFIYSDLQAPVVSELMLARSRVARGQDNVVYAFADDSASGEICTGRPGCFPTFILAMQFRIDDGVWRSMQPFPGPNSGDFRFADSEYEAAQGVFPPAAGIGMHRVCVRAIDSFANVSQPQCTDYAVVQ
jgi:hypothetical protein